MTVQTKTVRLALPSKEALVGEFVGQCLDIVRTPAMVIDRTLFAENCAAMHQKALDWGVKFRAHLKTHKTAEGTRLQLISSTATTSAVVVSTLLEAWQVVDAGLFQDGTVKDLLYGLPPGLNKLQDLSDLYDTIAPFGTLRLMLDTPAQVTALEKWEGKSGTPRKWSVFLKIDRGDKRAGVSSDSNNFEEMMKTAFKSKAIAVYGFYAHAGGAYASTSHSEASDFLSAEVDAVNTAAAKALELIATWSDVEQPREPFILSVGSTPSTMAAILETRAKLSKVLNGALELHAGNYPLLDLQQESVGMIESAQIAQYVQATVVSHYPGRGVDGTDEYLIDAGAIAFSKDTGPSGIFGKVNGTDWQLTRMSQEHGILTQAPGAAPAEKLELGRIVRVTGQHACLIAAAYPWYYIVDSNVDGGRTIVDVWVPWKGW